MHEPSSLSNQFLIAMPSLRDPNFARSVALVCQHGDDGAMGIMINRLSDYRLGDVLTQMNVRSELAQVLDAPVLIGGPVQPERGFVLHTPHGGWDSSFRISDQISVTTSRDILAPALKQAGFKVTFVQFHGDHELPDDVLDRALDDWLGPN